MDTPPLASSSAPAVPPPLPPPAEPRSSATTEALRQMMFERSLPREHGFTRLEVEGRVPDALRGTLYRNGPGLLELFGRRYQHPFEGDGAITAVRFDGDRVLGACRVTETPGLREERAAGEMLFNQSAPRWRRVWNAITKRGKNTANTSVLSWQGRLFALMEAARPVELDPVTLDTLGERDLDGVVGGMFSAHPHRVEARKTTYNFGLTYGRASGIDLYALPDDGPARRLGRVPLPAPVMLHDFIATERHLVFFVGPIRISIARAMTGLGDFRDLFQWKPQHGTEIIVVPIDRPAEVVRFTVPAFHQWHFANAYDEGDAIVVDYCRYPDFASFASLGRDVSDAALSTSRYHRARVEPRARRFTSEPVGDLACDFPRVRPGLEGQAHRYAWVAAGDLRSIARLDTRTGAVERHVQPAARVVTEPVIVRGASPREDDAFALTLGLDASRDQAFLEIYAADRLADGPVARAWFEHHVPLTFHGIWA